MNFNPRSREGSDFHQSSFNIYIFNFNPRSREGSDLSNFIPNVFFINFNPRSREGSDATIPTNCNRYDRISIHAPAKGATWCIGYQTFTATFQSTLPRRERRKHGRAYSLRYNFNPRSREGSDKIITDQFPVIQNFNPRSREGSDLCKLDIQPKIIISIHAPAKGATGC